MDGPPVLWHLEISHFNEKARWALDYKRVGHIRRVLTPGLQEVKARRLRAGRTSPILQLNGRAIGDSTRIIEEVERRWPDPPLYPADPDERRRALELEEHFDEVVAADTRRVLFADNIIEPSRFFAMFSGQEVADRKVIRALTPLLTRVIKRQFDVTPERVVRSRDVVRAAFAKVESETGPEGYLVGNSFSVADLTAASILSVLVVPPEFPYIHLPPDERPAPFRAFRDSLKETPGFRWVEEMYARHRGTSAEVAAADRRAH